MPSECQKRTGKRENSCRLVGGTNRARGLFRIRGRGTIAPPHPHIQECQNSEASFIFSIHEFSYAFPMYNLYTVATHTTRKLGLNFFFCPMLNCSALPWPWKPRSAHHALLQCVPTDQAAAGSSFSDREGERLFFFLCVGCLESLEFRPPGHVALQAKIMLTF